VIAIDGPAASGKSSTARRVARALGIAHLDSGALYRAATLARLRADAPAPPWSEQSVLDAARAVTVVREAARFEPRIAGARVSADLHGAGVTAHVSEVAKMPRVRAWVNEQLRACAARGPIVVDGRDMGTAVFPDAPLKVFLDAHPTERARRRAVQHLDRAPTDAELAVEAERLSARDARDATQTRRARDAVVIDTTGLTQEEQVSRIVALAMPLT
jgi:cytidylate kinase